MMNNQFFTVEEENLMCVFDVSSKAALINSINAASLDFDADEPEMREIAGSVLAKLKTMSDAEFSALILSPAYYDDESEV
jgi:hypothetical protein